MHNLYFRLTPSQMLEIENKKMEDKLKTVQMLMELEKQKRGTNTSSESGKDTKS